MMVVRWISSSSHGAWIRKSRLLCALLVSISLLPGRLDAEPAPTPSLHEAWDVAYMQGAKIGWIHTLTDRLDASGQAVLHTRQKLNMVITRAKNRAQVTAVTDSFELPDGRLYAIDTRIRTAEGTRLRTQGLLRDDGKFHLTSSAAPNESTTIDWSDDVLGPYAFERMLRERPMAPGQTRSYHTFEPQLNQITVNTLTAVGREKTTLRDGKQVELLRIDMRNDKIAVEISLWADERGSIVKMVMPFAGLSMTAYRVAGRSEATDEPIGDDVDFMAQTLVRADRPVPGAHATRSITYRLRLADDAAADAIPESTYQKIVARNGNSLVLKVQRVTPPEAGREIDSPGDEFLASNGFIQADDPKIRAIARQATAGIDDPWVKAQRLEGWVDRNMSNADFSVGFASASEALRTRKGDCTEHAVLLAALCRSVGVPARVAMGLVHIESAGAFGYHMWTEVNIGGEWYALDGTLGNGYVAGGHIKIADGSLKGASALGTFLPIVNVLGKLTIEVDKVE